MNNGQGGIHAVESQPAPRYGRGNRLAGVARSSRAASSSRAPNPRHKGSRTRHAARLVDQVMAGADGRTRRRPRASASVARRRVEPADFVEQTASDEEKAGARYSRIRANRNSGAPDGGLPDTAASNCTRAATRSAAAARTKSEPAPLGLARPSLDIWALLVLELWLSAE
jgi:hypothetical protein